VESDYCGNVIRNQETIGVVHSVFEEGLGYGRRVPWFEPRGLF